MKNEFESWSKDGLFFCYKGKLCIRINFEQKLTKNVQFYVHK